MKRNRTMKMRDWSHKRGPEAGSRVLGDRSINTTQRGNEDSREWRERREGESRRALGETDICCGRRKWMESRMEQSRDPALPFLDMPGIS